jgi:TolA-binding protein
MAVVADAAPDAAVADAAPIDAVEQGSGSAVAQVATGSGSGSGSADEIEMDPNTAEDLDPEKGSAATAQDEAADAPESGSAAEAKATAAEAKAPVAAPVRQATTLRGAVQLIKEGHRDAALSSLLKLRRDNPKSAYIPFLIGNLYFDKVWWSAAMDNYQETIRKNSAYRNNPTLNKNVITMLGSAKTRQRATNFLRGVIGHPAAAYLRYEAAHAENPVVKKQAANLARFIR